MAVLNSSSKIFCIGLPKTGTTSFGAALEHLGFSVSHENFGSSEPGYLRSSDFLDRALGAIPNYDGFQDGAWPRIYPNVLAKWPNSKFVLTTRSVDSWLSSMAIFGERHINQLQEIFGKGVFSGNERYFADQFSAHESECFRFFSDRSQPLLVIPCELPNPLKARLLCSYLGLGNDLSIYPHANLGRKNMIRRMLKRLTFQTQSY
ncbi:sulfotransferase [Cyanobium sp. ULC084]